MIKNNNLELLDIVDANNNIIGQASREEVHLKNLPHRAAHVFISYKSGNTTYIYLQLRSKNKAQFPNLWDISAAGHLDSGEDYPSCAIREVKEELELSIHPDQLRELGTLAASPDNGYEFITVYDIELNTMPNIKLALDEITTGAWFQRDHISHWVKTSPQDFAGCFDQIWCLYK